MTDERDIVERLRDHAKHQEEKYMESLDRDGVLYADSYATPLEKTLQYEAADLITRLLAANKAMGEALKPFAAMYDKLERLRGRDPTAEIQGPIVVTGKRTLDPLGPHESDLRRARTAYQQHREEGE